MCMCVMFACLRMIVIIFYSRYYDPIIGFCLVRYLKNFCSHQTTSVNMKTLLAAAKDY